MPQGEPRPGEKYRHFKEKLYQIVTVAEHSETGEALVIYQALYGDFKIYARPFSMFTSPVDREKYPEVPQEFRFQLVLEDSKPLLNKGQEEITESAGETAEQVPSVSIQKSMSAEEKLMAFFDAETMDEKYKILLEMRDDITDRMVNNMAVALDVVIEEGPIEQRYEDLKICVRTFRRYESNRLR